MDVRDIKYPSSSFDLAIDKSTIDALLCGESSYLNVAIMLKEVQRVLKVGGTYMIISYGKPENRLIHLERDHLDFDISVFTIKKESESSDLDKIHYVYVCKKGKNADAKCEKMFNKIVYDLQQQDLYDQEINSGVQEDEVEEDMLDQFIYEQYLNKKAILDEGETEANKGWTPEPEPKTKQNQVASKQNPQSKGVKLPNINNK